MHETINGCADINYYGSVEHGHLWISRSPIIDIIYIYICMHIYCHHVSIKTLHLAVVQIRISQCVPEHMAYKDFECLVTAEMWEDEKL